MWYKPKASLSSGMLYVTAKGIKGCSDKDDKNNLRPGKKKNLIWREIEKISGVYGGRELNKKGCDKSLCCQGCGKAKKGNCEKEPRGCERARACGRGAAEPAREVLWFNPFSVRPAQLDTRQAGGRARGIGKEPEFLPWAPEGNDTHWLPKPPALTLCIIRNSEKETGSVFVFFSCLTTQSIK